MKDFRESAEFFLEKLGEVNRDVGSFYDRYIKPYEKSEGSDTFNIQNANQKIQGGEDEYYKQFKLPIDAKQQPLEKDPITGDFDYSSLQPDLVEKIVRTFDGYKYDVKQEGNTVVIIFNQNIGADLVKKWSKLFPNNQYEGIPIEIDVKS